MKDQKDRAQIERRAYLISAIEGISAQLKGPGISTAERLMLHEDRKEFRQELVELGELAPPPLMPGDVQDSIGDK